jgi:hypothetical protein
MPTLKPRASVGVSTMATRTWTRLTVAAVGVLAAQQRQQVEQQEEEEEEEGAAE